MSSQTASQAKLTTIACFPKHYFLENLAIRSNGSILVTAMNQKELWYIPPTTVDVPINPILIHTFALPALSLVEVEPDIFYICISDVYKTHKSNLQRFDLRGWTPGSPLNPEILLEFPDPVRALNGSCLIAPIVMIIADSVAGLFWRVDLPTDGSELTARVWLKHDSMAFNPNSPLKPPQPGVNGVRYASRSHYFYYTTTAQKLFMRVRVDPDTHEPAAEPEHVANGRMFDDFCIDEDAGIAYITTHRENTIDRVSLEPSENRGVRHSVAGDPLTEQLLGPSSGVWGRMTGEYGRVAYFTTDGGTTSPPPDGIVRTAKVLRVEF
ncbi:hypothetical protein [Nostoc sp.]|uniref:hypothetical protein n=1 Tax=Nostoc sp. TaxID=1180 RepID=UPI002FFA1A11